MSVRPIPALYALAALLVAVGVAGPRAAHQSWLRSQAPTGEVPAPPAVPPASVASAVDGAALAAEVVTTNLFSPRRAAPALRYGSDTVAPPPAPTPKPAPPVIQLFGIGVTGAGATALLDADPAIPGAEIYRAGDALPGGGRLESIASDHVVVVTREGRQRIRLPQNAPSAPASAPGGRP